MHLSDLKHLPVTELVNMAVGDEISNAGGGSNKKYPLFTGLHCNFFCVPLPSLVYPLHFDGVCVWESSLKSVYAGSHKSSCLFYFLQCNCLSVLWSDRYWGFFFFAAFLPIGIFLGCVQVCGFFIWFSAIRCTCSNVFVWLIGWLGVFCEWY